MTLSFIGEITDPIHKNIKFTKVEKELIDTYIFQRLRRIRQLAGAHLVYPGALHSRFEHSIGSMFLAGMAGQTLLEKGYLQEFDTIQELRISALLHDIGHGPFSHLYEEVLSYSEFNSHEKMGEKIINETIIADTLKQNGFNPRSISDISFGKHKTRFLNEVISGGLSVDLMDYLPRDSYFSGTEYGKIDYFRIINSFEVSSSGELGISKSALYSYESMLISRYQMFKAVYFHKTVRAGEVMILNAMKNLIRHVKPASENSLEYFLNLHDEMILDTLSAIEGLNESSNDFRYVQLLRDYKNRKLLKCIYEYLSLSNKRYGQDQLLQNSMINKAPSNLEYFLDFDARVSRIKKFINTSQSNGEFIFLDISKAPSIPLAPKKEEVTSIMIVDRKGEYEKSFDQIPLINVISGYLDMIRLYTTKENRGKYEDLMTDLL
ncbi:MAG: HD domain-containing protein [Candidatus Nitrosocosmicus sp.]